MSETITLSGITSAFTVRSSSDFWDNLSTYCPGNDVIGWHKNSFINKGFVKYVCVFGILISTKESYPDANIQYAANILAHLLDRECTAKYENIDRVRRNMYNSWAYPCDPGENGNQDCNDGDDLSSITGMKGHRAQFMGDGTDESLLRDTINEEIFHMVQQHGWNREYPCEVGIGNPYFVPFGGDLFGKYLQSFTASTSCQEMQKFVCTDPGWNHPNANCPDGAPFSPGNPASVVPTWLSGDCVEPSCYCLEWFHQAFLISLNQLPTRQCDDAPRYCARYNWYMPTTQADMRAMLSDSFKNMIDDTSSYPWPTGPYLDNAKTNCYAANGISGEPQIGASGSAGIFNWMGNAWNWYWKHFIGLNSLTCW